VIAADSPTLLSHFNPYSPEIPRLSAAAALIAARQARYQKGVRG